MLSEKKNVFTSYIEYYNKIIGFIDITSLINEDIRIPTIQRLDDQNKTDEIKKYQLNYYMNGSNHFNFLGTINIHCCKEDKKNYILDGQHRYNAIKELAQFDNFKTQQISIEIITVNTKDELKENYKLINMNTPLPDFPDDIDKNIPEEVFKYFEKKWNNTIWKLSNRPSRPHLKKTWLQETFAYIILELNIIDPNDLIKLVEEKNEKMSHWNIEQFDKIRRLKDTSNMIEKCKSFCSNNGVFLGMYPHIDQDYGYEWAADIIKENTGIQPKKTINQNKKKTIPAKLKQDVWNKFIGVEKGIGNCKCCKKQIDKASGWHAGHIKSEANGGEILVDNLRPICGSCNSSMGIKNMRDFMNEIAEYKENLSELDLCG